LRRFLFWGLLFHLSSSRYKNKKGADVDDESITINCNTGDVVNIVKLTTKVSGEAETSEVLCILELRYCYYISITTTELVCRQIWMESLLLLLLLLSKTITITIINNIRY
jgi:hypothetical protein